MDNIFNIQKPSQLIFSISLFINNFFSYISSGDILAKSFKWIYAKCCLCRICPKIARRRLMREKKKLRMQTVDRDYPVNNKLNVTKIQKTHNTRQIKQQN